MDVVSLVVGGIVGSAVAGVIAFLLADRRGRAVALQWESKASIAEGRANDLSQRASAIEAQLRTAADDKLKLESARATLEANLLAEREKTVEQLKALDDRAQFIATTEAHLKDAFARVSTEALQTGNKQLLELAQARFAELTTNATGSLEKKKLEMENLLQPMRQTLALYRESLDKLEATRVEAYASLSTKLGEVARTQELVGVEARQLSNALRKSQVRGAWGELTLRRMMEMAGLQDRVVFEEQVSVDTHEKGRQRPDCVVRLPNAREVLIDSKAVLDAFMDGANCTEDSARIECFRRHARQVRAKVDDLSRKAYWEEFGKSADYIVLFLPGEAFLYAAVEHDPGLIEYALQSKVIVASPTTLLGLLKVIEFGWEKKTVEENADRIRELGVELHNRVSTLSEKFARLGGALESAMKAYNETLASLESRVFSQARKIGELGAVSAKEVALLDELPVHARELGKPWATLPEAD
jgi:DNA recombination protein RmuC